MSDHATKAISTADKIVCMVNEALAGLSATIVGWPAEFRIIIWEAVSATALNRAETARRDDAAVRELARRQKERQ